MIPETQFLKLENISLAYGSVSALQNINLSFNHGEVHAVVGEHGAGKSSLALLISGFLRPDSGQFIYKENSTEALTPKIAKKRGIEIVTQHNALFDDFSVAENILIDGKAGLTPYIARGNSVKKVRKYIQSLGIDLDCEISVRNLNRADRAFVDIIKNLYKNPSMLILDETLENLSNSQRHQIVELLNEKKRRGMVILFITHRIDDIYNFADKISIIRDGGILLSDHVSNVDKIMLIRLAYTHALKEKRILNDVDFSNILRYNEAILTDLPVTLLVVDHENKIKLLNQKAKKLLGLPEINIDNMILGSIFPGGNKESLQLIEQATRSQKNESFYRVPLNLAGHETINTIVTYPIFNDSRLIGTVIIIDDITQQERLRDQVALSENLASIGLLAAGVAHEINNPLDIMSLYLEKLRFNNNGSDIQQSVAALEEEIESIAHIVGNLITFSDKKNEKTESFNIVQLLKDLINLLDYNAQKNNITIKLFCLEEELFITANRTEMKQVILNIIRNSFEAMPNGGIVTISISLLEDNGLSSCRIFIDDTGKGIEEGKEKNIFMPFYSTKSGTEKNIGLGLSISYNIVKKYGGLISVENRKKGGCRFTLVIPVTDGENIQNPA